MKILVTGAAGFLGSAIVTELLQNKFDVYCLGSPRNSSKNGLPNFFRANIRDYESLRSLEKLEKIDVIIHTAGLAHQFGQISEEDFWQTNVEGTKNTLALATKLGIGHFILISSVAVYGKPKIKKENSKNSGNKRFTDENDFCEPESIYARSKLEGEKAARKICQEHQIPLTILRPATIIGEGDEGNILRLIKAIDKKRFVWIGAGENYKSLIYKVDVARACRIVLKKKGRETDVYNLTAEPVKMSEIVGQIASILKRNISDISIPAGILMSILSPSAYLFRFGKIQSLSETIEKWLSEEVFSSEKIKEVYGFCAETAVLEAVKRETEFYKNRK